MTTTSTDPPRHAPWVCPVCGEESHLNDWMGDPPERECRRCKAVTAMTAEPPRCWRGECREACYYPGACSEPPSDERWRRVTTDAATPAECCASGRCEVCTPGFVWGRDG